jgi:hypothetical protein
MINEKDNKIASLEAEVKKLKDAKSAAYGKFVDAKEKHGSSDKFFHTDIVTYRKLKDAHDAANAAWDKAYEKLQKLKKASKSKDENMNLSKQLMSVVEELGDIGELEKEQVGEPVVIEDAEEDDLEDEEIEEDDDLEDDEEADMTDGQEVDESAKGDAQRKSEAKAKMSNAVEKIRKDSQKLQIKKKDTSDDAEYERLEARLSANHAKVAKLKDDFAKKWSK